MRPGGFAPLDLGELVPGGRAPGTGGPAAGAARRHRPGRSWRAGSPGVTNRPAAEGAWLFQAKGCAACRADPARGFPDLTGAPEWAAGRTEGMPADEYLAESILDPDAVFSPQLPAWSTHPAHAPAERHRRRGRPPAIARSFDPPR